MKMIQHLYNFIQPTSLLLILYNRVNQFPQRVYYGQKRRLPHKGKNPLRINPSGTYNLAGIAFVQLPTVTKSCFATTGPDNLSIQTKNWTYTNRGSCMNNGGKKVD